MKVKVQKKKQVFKYKHTVDSEAKFIAYISEIVDDHIENRYMNKLYHYKTNNKVFNMLYYIDDSLSSKIYEWCKETNVKPIKSSLLNDNFINDYLDFINYINEKYKFGTFTTIKKIYNPANDNFYLVLFTFNDQEIKNIKVIKKDNKDKDIKLIQLKEFNKINVKKYKKKTFFERINTKNKKK